MPEKSAAAGRPLSTENDRRSWSDGGDELEDFKPVGTVFILVLFVAALILLWLSVYVILLSRGATG